MIERNFVHDQMGGHWTISVNGKFFCNVSDSELNEASTEAEREEGRHEYRERWREFSSFI